MAKNPRLIDITGQTYGEYFVVRQVGNTPKGASLWLCKCSCGEFRNVAGGDLRNGKSKSCGHGLKEILRKRTTTHGGTKTRLYKIFRQMHNRCENSKSPSFADYGGRGIKVCAKWEKFEPFRDWAMANGYSKHLSIDRKNNDLGYCPENCRWATKEQQSVNRRFVKRREDGTPWWHIARGNGITSGAYRTRLFNGWTHQEAATWPMYRKRPLKNI